MDNDTLKIVRDKATFVNTKINEESNVYGHISKMVWLFFT